MVEFFFLAILLAFSIFLCSSKGGKGKDTDKTGSGRGSKTRTSKTGTTASFSAPPPAGASLTPEQIEQEKQIAAAIRKGDLLPPDDNETVNDVQSNWGAKQTVGAK